MLSAANEYTADGTDVVVITTPCQRDVMDAGNHIIRGIEIDPTDLATVHRDPGVRCIRADQPRFPRRRESAEVPADIPGGQPQAAQASDLNMGEVLTDTAASGKSFLQRRVDA